MASYDRSKSPNSPQFVPHRGNSPQKQHRVHHRHSNPKPAHSGLLATPVYNRAASPSQTSAPSDPNSLELHEVDGVGGISGIGGAEFGVLGGDACGTGMIDPASLEILPLEYFTDIDAGERKAMDVIIRVNLLGRPNAPESSRVSVVVNCEHQSTTKADFNRRLFFYFAQLHRKYLQPVYPIALFSFDEPYRPERDSYQVRVPGLQVLEFNFLTIQLNRLDWRAFLTQSNPVAAALMAKMKIDPVDRPRVKVECLRMIASLKLDKARTFLLSGFIDNYLRLNPIEEQQFQVEVDRIKLPTERENVMELTTSWMEKGIVQGRESEGRGLVVKQLTRKLGNLSPELLARVNGLNLDRVEALAEDLLDFTSVGDLERWLAV